MKVLSSLYRFLNILSIDVALGACTMSFLVGDFLGVFPSHFSHIVLFLSVWAVYTIDHLYDAHQLKEKAISTRHQFHYKHKKLLTILLIIAILTASGISFTLLPTSTLLYGFGVTIFVLFHLLLVKFLGSKVSIFVQKELSVALTYALGICIPSLSIYLGAINLEQSLFFIQLLLLAFINLCQFSFFDYSIDEQNAQTSIVRFLGKKKATYLIWILLILQFIVNGVSLIEGIHSMHQLILLSMGIVLLIIFIFKNFFAINNRYRFLGDAIFLFPLVLLFL
ncbi:MAG: hypothetical protein GY827_12810 [Cytophagales bacterium]|nr:hypothetical protein [Cytophagales bacterium]